MGHIESCFWPQIMKMWKYDIFECMRSVQIDREDREEVNYIPGEGVYGPSDAFFSALKTSHYRNK